MTVIEDYALVGDMQTSCLISLDGSADWMCLPDFEAPAVFAALLGTDEHGSWQIRPKGEATSTHRYLPGTLVLETTWRRAEGTVRVLDFMPPHSAGSPGSPQLIRIVQGVAGTVRMVSRARIRFSYGQVAPRRERIPQAFGSTRHRAVAGADAVWLDSSVPMADQDGHTRADFTVQEGEQVAFALTWQPSHLGPPPYPDPDQALTDTTRFWTDWSARSTYAGPYSEAVSRSLITLKALTYAPTGAIVAAPTTSLPEDIGGSRNWDYRYTWLRDAAITLAVLVRTGYLDEARAWREWLLRAVAGDPSQLQIMYGITGRRDLPETVLVHLPGYENSRPVRVGNGAARQLQLDVYGEVIETLHLGHLAGLDHHDDAYQLQIELIQYLEHAWQEMDEGIWEVRGERRHFVHSKVMAWVAVDRMIKLVESGDATGPVERWRHLRQAIHDDVCTNGYDAERNTFTQSYGSKELDAALLLLPQVGFLLPSDKRVIGTVEAIQRELSTPEGFISRYPTAGHDTGVDGLPGDEGTFLACSFWMVEALAMIGREEEARCLFDKLLALRNAVGLLAEEYDSDAHRQVGNFPQAFSHFALIQAALRLDSVAATDGPRDDVLASPPQPQRSFVTNDLEALPVSPGRSA
ncbi:glycoside hydrolase family 15 protein [Streptomyces sp. NPDC049597]|uniref:glycoside hydrolase family 15 protein n=1 Tax=Streptomyces sp. NPDC049597 TaxID=3155276 RepID=UPI003439D607